MLREFLLLSVQITKLRRNAAEDAAELKLKDWQVLSREVCVTDEIYVLQMRSMVRGVFNEQFVTNDSEALASVLRPETLRGYMNKKGQGMFDGWSQRWFVLDGDVLTWFKDQSKEGVEAKGSLNMTTIENLECLNAELAIRLMTQGRTYELEALSHDDFLKWSRGIIRFVNPLEAAAPEL